MTSYREAHRMASVVVALTVTVGACSSGPRATLAGDAFAGVKAPDALTRLPGSQPRAKQLPLLNAIVNFP